MILQPSGFSVSRFFGFSVFWFLGFSVFWVSEPAPPHQTPTRTTATEGHCNKAARLCTSAGFTGLVVEQRKLLYGLLQRRVSVPPTDRKATTLQCRSPGLRATEARDFAVAGSFEILAGQRRCVSLAESDPFKYKRTLHTSLNLSLDP